MKPILLKTILTVFVTTLVAACATTQSPLPQEQVKTLLRTVPAQTADDRDTTSKQFLRGGEATIVALFHQVVPTGAGDDTAVRTALNGIAKYASRPGAEKQRRAFENAALAALPILDSNEAKAFTIRQLEVAGSDASVDTLNGLLTHDALAQPAITVLQLIATSNAKSALYEALGTSSSTIIDTAIIKALGELRHEVSARKITPYASSSDRALRFTALYALANIGNPSSKEALTKAVQSSKGYDQTEAKSLLALYQRRRAE